MIFDWFDARAATQFGTSLAEFFVERVPLDSKADKRKSGKKRSEIFPKLVSQISRFKQENKLNLYKKAKLGNAFRWKLLDLGYDKEFADEMTKELLLNV